MEGGGAGDSASVYLPGSGKRQISAKEFWVVLVRQWVDRKDCEQERLLGSGRLIWQWLVRWDQDERVPFGLSSGLLMWLGRGLGPASCLLAA